MECQQVVKKQKLEPREHPVTSRVLNLSLDHYPYKFNDETTPLATTHYHCKGLRLMDNPRPISIAPPLPGNFYSDILTTVEKSDESVKDVLGWSIARLYDPPLPHPAFTRHRLLFQKRVKGEPIVLKLNNCRLDLVDAAVSHWKGEEEFLQKIDAIHPIHLHPIFWLAAAWALYEDDYKDDVEVSKDDSCPKPYRSFRKKLATQIKWEIDIEITNLLFCMGCIEMLQCLHSIWKDGFRFIFGKRFPGVAIDAVQSASLNLGEPKLFYWKCVQPLINQRVNHSAAPLDYKVFPIHILFASEEDSFETTLKRLFVVFYALQKRFPRASTTFYSYLDIALAECFGMILSFHDSLFRRYMQELERQTNKLLKRASKDITKVHIHELERQINGFKLDSAHMINIYNIWGVQFSLGVPRVCLCVDQFEDQPIFDRHDNERRMMKFFQQVRIPRLLESFHKDIPKVVLHIIFEYWQDVPNEELVIRKKDEEDHFLYPLAIQEEDGKDTLPDSHTSDS